MAKTPTKQPHIVVIGDFMADIDRHYQTTQRQSPDGAYSVTRLGSVSHRPGGAGAVAAMARAQGARVDPIGGDIRVSTKIRHILDHRIVFREDDERTAPIAKEYAESLVGEVDPKADVILCADYGKGIVTPYLWERLVNVGPPVIVDPYWHGGYPGAWGIVPGIRELGHIESIGAATSIAEMLAESIPRVVVKLAERGMVAHESGNAVPTHYYIAECSNPVDVCGAGDMVLASIGVAIARGCGWHEAARWGNAMAAEKCRRWGAVAVRLEDTERRPPWLPRFEDLANRAS